MNVDTPERVTFDVDKRHEVHHVNQHDLSGREEQEKKVKCLRRIPKVKQTIKVQGI